MPALLIAAAAVLGPAALAPAALAQAPGAAAPAIIRGHIADQTGALIPGAKVTINDTNGKAVANVTADEGGAYEVKTLAPGNYVIMAQAEGFAPFVSQPITVAGAQIKRVDIAMAIQTEQQQVVVTDESPTVSVDADNNGNSLVIKGADLDALSDDPDELSSELSALAGPSAGPNGGQIYIDGFSGGQLPPKSSIREIRVNQNPYSAEYDRLGFGRIEILTKPGTDKLHGQFFIQGNDDAFNTGNPFTKNIPPYYSYQYNGTLNGSLSKWASFFISAEHRTINNVNVYDTPIEAGSVFNPRSRTNVAPRVDIQIGAKNTLTVRYQYYHDGTSGDLNSTELPTEQTSTDSNTNTLQVSDTQIISDHIVNETRFEYERSTSSTTPFSTAPTFDATGAFSGGGSPTQLVHDHADQLEFQNLTTMSLGKHAVKFGTRLRDFRDANTSDAGFNGNFTFNSTAAYEAAFADPSTAAPTQLIYSTGTPQAIGNVFDAALFVQDDWKIRPTLTLSGGLRWESQNHVNDHSDWAPRFSLAWALDGKNGKQAKTVFRAGYGIFYDRLGVGNFLTINRSTRQQQYAVENPAPSAACFASSLTALDLATCGIGSPSTQTHYQVAPSYRSPYTQQIGASIERQLSKAQTLTVTYLHSEGIHQLVEINVNAPNLAGTPVHPYDATLGQVFQYFPEGIFKQDQLIVNTNARFSPNFNVFGFYTLNFANTDGSGGTNAAHPFDLGQDYGRASFVSRNSLFLIGNYNGPWGIRFAPFLVAQSGRPFNITTGNDLNGDSVYNDRPGVVASSNCTATSPRYRQTSYGCLDTTPDLASGEKIIAYDSGNGPSAVAVNLRVSRAFGIGPKVQADPNSPNGGGPPGGGPPGGGRGGPGGGGRGGFGPGGFGGGGGRGGPFGGQAGTGRKYSLNFSVQALNLFNNIDYGTPVGAVTPAADVLASGTDFFGHSTSLQQGLFSQGSAARRVFLQAVFSF